MWEKNAYVSFFFSLFFSNYVTSFAPSLKKKTQLTNSFFHMLTF